ncbi:TPA: DUF2285 domain-containing protein [Pseudomonas aeruginosa]
MRRNPEYHQDWQHRSDREAAGHRWGLRTLELPSLDAREAQPAWLYDSPGTLQIYPDADPPASFEPFDLWRWSGHKRLLHDGRRLLLTEASPGGQHRVNLLAGLRDGMSYVFAVRPHTAVRNWGLPNRIVAPLPSRKTGVALPRPSSTVMQHFFTIQALDATLSGASLRQVAICLFGSAQVAEGWYADSDLRAKTRRLVRRGRFLMSGGYRGLVGLPPV